MPYITDIKDQSFVTRAMMKVGRVAAIAYNVFKGENVEKDADTYKDFFLTKAEMVEQRKLSNSQLKVICATAGYSELKPFYMVTMAQAPDINNETIKERQFFVTKAGLDKMGLRERTTLGHNAGDGKTALTDQVYTLKTLGQYWGHMRPRILEESIEVSTTPGHKKESLSLALKHPRLISKAPKAGMMTPK